MSLLISLEESKRDVDPLHLPYSTPPFFRGGRGPFCYNAEAETRSYRHRFPTAATQEDLLRSAEPFKKWFTLSEGGFHTDGKSQTVLIAFQDGVYLELICVYIHSAHKSSMGPKNPNWTRGLCVSRHPKGEGRISEGMPGGRGKVSGW